MVDILYSALMKYFNKLYNIGYVNDKELYNILFLTFIYEFVNEDFKSYITEEDYKSIGNVLNNIFGTSCLIPYPDYCKYKGMNTFNLTQLTDITTRLNTLESEMSTIGTTKVIKNLQVVEEL